MRKYKITIGWGLLLALFLGLSPALGPVVLHGASQNMANTGQDQLDKAGESAFTLVQEEYVQAMDANLITYEHMTTGAKVLHLKNSDPNQAFAIGFKTPIYDNTGVNHIVEHTVFTGSQKYNIKDVFFEMKKKSPSIFMNASTAADMTIYPFATRNQVDYYNLLDVYLDAVFFPNLQKHRYGFDQEGWHYSVDGDHKFHLSGVVYNEMKGASVAPRRILAMANRAAMFPDTMYIYNAGGSPEEIPSLSYEAFKDTHKTYYVPSNSCAFIYGDVDTDQVLGKLDAYYRQFKKKPAQHIAQKQEPARVIKDYTDYYPALSADANYYLSTNFAVGTIDDVKLQFSMGILMDILTKYDQSPLRKAFREEQKGKTLSYDVDGAIPQPMYSIVTTDLREEDLGAVAKLIQETLETTAQEGFSPDLIKMAINNYDIRAKEQTSDISKGVDMAYTAIYSWGHDVAPIKTLRAQDYLEEIKQEGDSAYFERLLTSQLLENSHKSQVVLAPDDSYIAKAQAGEQRKIALEEANNDIDKVNMLIESKKNLEAWQQEKPLPGSLPELRLEDLNQTSPLPKLTIKEKKNNLSMYYLAQTNGLIYTDLYFDTAYIPQESLNELFLFAHLISQREKDLVALYTGGITCSPIAIPDFEWYNNYKPKLKLSVCMEKGNIKEAFEVLEKLTDTDGWDQQWVLTQIHKIRHYYEHYLNTSPLDLMNVTMGSTQQGPSRYEYEKIIPFYHYICAVEQDYDRYKDQITDKLAIINASVFNQDKLVLGATLEEKNIKLLEKNYNKYRKKLSKQAYASTSYDFINHQKRQGVPVASDVQYITWGGNYKEKGGSYDGSLYVLGNILNAEYLLPHIRVKNGAYGAGIKFNPYGNINVYTYQDPKLAESLGIIEDIPHYIDGLKIDAQALDAYKIGAFSKFEQELGLSDHPVAIGETLQRYYLSGLTDEQLEQVKKEIFSTSLEDIKQQGLILEKVMGDRRYSVAGSQAKLLTNSHHFDIIQSFQSNFTKP